MNELKNRFHAYRQVENDKKNPDTWWMYECTTPKNAEEVAYKYINREPEKIPLSLEMNLALSTPSISDYYRFRHNDSTESNYDKYAAMMEHYTTTIPLILYRGVSQIPFDCMCNAAKQLEDPSVQFWEKGFLNTSLLPDCANHVKGIKQMKIFVPPLTNVFFVGHLIDDYNPNQKCFYECIVQRGAKLTVVKEDDDYYYCFIKETI